MQRRLGQLLALAGSLFIGVATLIPLPADTAAAAHARETPIWCLICGNYGGVDVVDNLLLFIPFALGLRLCGIWWVRVVLISAALSFSIETLQYAVIPGRDPSLSDFLTNTLSSGIGASLGSQVSMLLIPTKREARVLAAAAATLWLAVQVGTALLLQPWIPAEPLRAEWGRGLPGRPVFKGTVTSAGVAGVVVPDGMEPVDQRVKASLRQGRPEIQLALVTGPKPARWAPVFELSGWHGAVLSVEAEGQDLAFHPASRAYGLRLKRPTLRLPGALPPDSGIPVRLSAGQRRDTLWASSSARSNQKTAVQVLSPSQGWSLIAPFLYPTASQARLLTALWLAALLLPSAFFGARSRIPRSGLLFASALLLLTGLGLVPQLTGFSPVHLSEWVAGIVGMGSGWAASQAAAYFGH